MAIKVKLRQKPISGNRLSLYLDIYPPIPNPDTGELTRREFLGLYIDNEIVTDKEGKKRRIKLDPFQKHGNQENLQLAEQIRQKKENQLNKPEIYTGYEKEQLRIKEKGEQNFVEYFKSLADKRQASNHDNWVSAYKYLENFTNGKLLFKDLDVIFCNKFKEYLLTIKSRKSEKTLLSQNSALSYFNKLKAALKQAYKDGLLQFNINENVEPIKQSETQRNFLTIEELNKLVETKCQNQQLKNAALFSALTGLRFSDIAKMIWSEVEYMKGQGYSIRHKQQKTKNVETLPISKQAFSLLGERKEPSNKVFEGMKYSAYGNKHLFQWIGAAGITKDITFHCFRHTYAILQLSEGTDVTTIQKMLGHKDLKTTLVYAKVMDKAKRNTTDKINLDF